MAMSLCIFIMMPFVGLARRPRVALRHHAPIWVCISPIILQLPPIIAPFSIMPPCILPRSGFAAGTSDCGFALSDAPAGW